jgi:hypothetical protein
MKTDHMEMMRAKILFGHCGWLRHCLEVSLEEDDKLLSFPTRSVSIGKNTTCSATPATHPAIMCCRKLRLDGSHSSQSYLSVIYLVVEMERRGLKKTVRVELESRENVR